MAYVRPTPRFVKFASDLEDCEQISGVGVSFRDEANGGLLLRQAIPVAVGAPPEDVARALETLAAWVRNRVRSRYEELAKEKSEIA